MAERYNRKRRQRDRDTVLTSVRGDWLRRDRARIPHVATPEHLGI